MMRRLLLALAFVCAVTAAQAQGCGASNPNCVVPLAPNGDNSNRAASTKWVQANGGGGGGGTSPGGSNTQVQYNAVGSFGGITGATSNGTTLTLVAPILGTPASVTLTNGTGLPVATGVSGLAANIATWLTTPSSANLAAALTDETGSGSAVFGTSPSIATPSITSPTISTGATFGFLTGSTQCLHVSTSGVLSGTGSDCGSGSGGTPGGSTTQVQYNNAGAFAGITGATTNGSQLTLASPILGTPASVTLTNATGLPISSGVSGLGTGIATFLGTPSSANLAAALTDETGSGVAVFGTAPTVSSPTINTAATLGFLTGSVQCLHVNTSGTLSGTGSDCGSGGGGGPGGSATQVQYNSSGVFAGITGATSNGTALTLVAPILGTPASVTLTNGTGLPISSGVSGLATGVATFLATPSSANLLAALTTSTGTGNNVFATSPTLVTPVLGTPTSVTLTNATGLPLSTGVTGTLAPTNLPTPTASTLGGIQSLASTAHQWIFTISTLGVPSSSQPACGDLSNAGTACQATTGTGGGTLPFLNGTNTWSGTQTFGSVVGTINTQTGTTYTLAATDCGKTVLITNASGITLTTLNSIPAGCAIAVEQGGAGQITVANGSGATLTSAHSFTHTFNAAGAIIGLFVDTNSGTNAHYVLTGDGA